MRFMTKRDSFIFYRSFYEALQDLPNEQRLEIYDAISNFSLNFQECELQGISSTIFKLIKPQLEANNKRFINGSKPKKSKTEAKRKQVKSKTEANNNVNVNDNVNDNVNVNQERLLRVKSEFKNSLQTYLGTYDKDLLNDFYLYWTEKKPRGRKFRFEMEKTFDIERRLQRWKKNDFTRKSNPKEQPFKSKLDAKYN